MESMHELINRIYDAALAPENWNQVLELFNQRYKAISTGFFTQSDRHELLFTQIIGMDDSYWESYDQYYAAQNPWLIVPGLMRPGRILTDHSLERLHGTRDAFTGTEIYNEWYGKQDFRHTMGGTIVDHSGDKLNFTVNRPAQAGYYTTNEIQELKILSKHIMRAVAINQRIQHLSVVNTASEAAYESLNLGVWAVNKRLKVIYQNVYAKKLRDTTDIFSKDEGAVLNPGQFKEVNSKLLSRIEQDRKDFISIPRVGKPPLMITIIPCRRSGWFGIQEISAILFVSNPDDRVLGSQEYIEQRWALTPMEAQFTLLMLHGKTITRIAEELSLTKATAQWYSKQVMNKLGVNRQAEVILKVLSDISLRLNQ
jgi:DNA-binding CsgD family transcriptional regulator